MQSKMWLFSLMTTTILIIFYLLAVAINVAASGFLITAFLITAVSGYLQVTSAPRAVSKMMKGERS